MANDETKTVKNLAVINEMIDVNENASYSIVDPDMNPQFIVVFDNGKITKFTEDGQETSYDDRINDLISDVNNEGFYFHKLIEGNHRWEEYNPNPDGNRTGDCSLRAYCAAFGWTWEQAYDHATEAGKKISLMMNDHKTCVAVMASQGYTIDKEFRKSKDKPLTVNEFAMRHPYGTYILNTHGHLVTVKNGKYFDSWDSGSKKVNRIFKKQ